MPRCLICNDLILEEDVCIDPDTGEVELICIDCGFGYRGSTDDNDGDLSHWEDDYYE
jgi:hypothetical protein